MNKVVLIKKYGRFDFNTDITKWKNNCLLCELINLLHHQFLYITHKNLCL